MPDTVGKVAADRGSTPYLVAIETLLYSALPLLAGMPAVAARQDPVMIAVVIGFVILSLGLHEFAHAWVAWKCGDSTAKDLGRLTLNPIAHIDPVFTIVVPLVLYLSAGILFGGAKPVPVVYSRLRSPARDMMLVAIAGPITNFLLAILFLLVWKVLVYNGIYQSSETLPKVLTLSMELNLLLAAFNMIPIPPLDGSRVLAFFLPPHLRQTYQGFDRFGLLIVIVLMATGALTPTILGVLAHMEEFVHWGTGGVWS